MIAGGEISSGFSIHAISLEIYMILKDNIRQCFFELDMIPGN